MFALVSGVVPSASRDVVLAYIIDWIGEETPGGRLSEWESEMHQPERGFDIWSCLTAPRSEGKVLDAKIPAPRLRVTPRVSLPFSAQ